MQAEQQVLTNALVRSSCWSTASVTHSNSCKNSRAGFSRELDKALWVVKATKGRAGFCPQLRVVQCTLVIELLYGLGS